jgi:hypothetical protein
MIRGKKSYDNNLWLYIFSSSCFQLVGKESYDLNDMQSLLQDPNNIDLNKVYDKYNVEGVQVIILFHTFRKCVSNTVFTHTHTFSSKIFVYRNWICIIFDDLIWVAQSVVIYKVQQ